MRNPQLSPPNSPDPNSPDPNSHDETSPKRDRDLAHRLRGLPGVLTGALAGQRSQATDAPVPPSARSPDPSPVDLSVLAELTGDPVGTPGDFVDSLLATWSGETTRQLEELDEALRASDTALAARLVHTMKGASATVGARVVTAACVRLETALRAETADWATAGPELQSAVTDAESAFAPLRTHRPTSTGANR